MRKASKAPEKIEWKKDQKNSDVIVEERTYEFLTPVFGGGVKIDKDAPHKKPHDPVTPVRAASIRGQLRFWWRACNPRGCTTVKELKEAEDAIFGSTEQAGALRIAVTKQPAAPGSIGALLDGDAFRSAQGKEGLAYGAFPLRDSRKGMDKTQLVHGKLHEYRGTWALTLSYPQEFDNDVRGALWAWCHFGGLGGRTRRGFGAVHQVSPAIEPPESGWQKYVSQRHTAWPSLGPRDSTLRLIPCTEKDATAALNRLLEQLRSFRQQVGVGRNPGQERNRPGRSRWPEPDAIRALTGQGAPPHRSRLTRADVFPRAAFGMPIIFHFKDRGEPQDTTLLPDGMGRMASRLILRPHRAPGGTLSWLALRLWPKELPPVRLQGVPNCPPLRAGLRPTDREGLGQSSPLFSNGQLVPDPIERFFQRLTSNR
jgi:CRISPR-associated protein Cmr1